MNPSEPGVIHHTEGNHITFGDPNGTRSERTRAIEAVVGAVVELGERLGVPMPATRAVYAYARLLDEHRRRRVVPRVEGVMA